MPEITIKVKKEKSVDKWSTKDFLIYFSRKLNESTGNYLEIPKEAWAGFTSRMKNFIKGERLTNIEYKRFIDDVFIEFSKMKYEVTFGCIVSKRVLYLIRNLKGLTVFTNDDFKELKKELNQESFLNNLQLNLNAD
ncbi:MAG: hypothetical protein M0R03_12815 [Novosphingobium sp.]|nr:hypothetical protein [Novosphingobium sp.]